MYFVLTKSRTAFSGCLAFYFPSKEEGGNL
jgi:hypothetical protein